MFRFVNRGKPIQTMILCIGSSSLSRRSKAVFIFHYYPIISLKKCADDSVLQRTHLYYKSDINNTGIGEKME